MDVVNEGLWRLLPGLGIGRLGSRCYVFDRHALRSPVLAFRTQRISERLHDVLDRLLKAGLADTPRPLMGVLALCSAAGAHRVVDLLIRKGFIVDATAARSRANLQDPLAQPFRATRFFHLPEDLPPDELEVALVGVPRASAQASLGVEFSPDALRLRSQQTLFWFDVYEHGLYSDASCNGRLPSTRCRGLRLGDLGDLGRAAATVADLFREIGAFNGTQLQPRGIRPIYVGGDHAITFPLVVTHARSHDRLCLIHFDAHNDLLFSDAAGYHHAAVIHSVLGHQHLDRILSLGLRTTLDPRTSVLHRLADRPELGERLRPYALRELKRMLAAPEEFRRLVRDVAGDRPCYLSIDLDVLSAASIGGRLSTPAGPGLEWGDLFAAVEHIFDAVPGQVIAADVVEYNVLAGEGPLGPTADDVLALIVRLAEGLSRRRDRATAGR